MLANASGKKVRKQCKILDERKKIKLIGKLCVRNENFRGGTAPSECREKAAVICLLINTGQTRREKLGNIPQ
jgi:hypothetical protein